MEVKQEFLKHNAASTSTTQHTQDIPMYEIMFAWDHTSEVHPGNQVVLKISYNLVFKYLRIHHLL
jgi:hypothetical protein